MRDKIEIQTYAQSNQIRQRRANKLIQDENDTLRLQIKELLEKNNELLETVKKDVKSLKTVANSNKKDIKELRKEDVKK